MSPMQPYTPAQNAERFGPENTASEYSALYQDDRIAGGQVVLADFIATLTAADQTLPVEAVVVLPNEKTVTASLTNPHSNRGFFPDLSFKPDTTQTHTVAEVLTLATAALGHEFAGWKGGKFRMNANTPIWVAFVGEVGEAVRSVEVTPERVLLRTEPLPL